jgi:phosphate:Na+ symporter
MSGALDTTITVLGGVGLFLLGMTVMTDGLKALAGSSLRAALGKAAATPLSGAFWGAIVTLLVQSSSAVTMTTIGLVSAGLLTFPQGLGLVFGANVGTTGTGWLVALIGVRVSLSAYALPMIFAGALVKLLAAGRVAATGASLAGFALVLYGLTTLQQGMGGLAERLHPSDVPSVLGMADVGWAAGSAGLITLVLVGLAMTAVMQSSTAAIAVTMSAFYAGAIGLEQGAALIIGQNIGTATSSALAAIGASTTAKRLALAYVLFKMIAALIALASFPFTVALMRRLAPSVDGVTQVAAYHTAYNVVGVAVLLPATQWFTRFVERLLPARESPLIRTLDPAALVQPVVAIEAVRRVVAEAREFLSDLKVSPETDAERHRMIETLRALDHVSRMIEVLGEVGPPGPANGGEEDLRAAELCKQAMRWGGAVADSITAESALGPRAESIGWTATPEAVAALAETESAAKALAAMQRGRRMALLASVGPAGVTAAEAFARVDAAHRLDALAHHAWRSAAHLIGRDEGEARTT